MKLRVGLNCSTPSLSLPALPAVHCVSPTLVLALQVAIYLNRLSDYLFTAARFVVSLALLGAGVLGAEGCAAASRAVAGKQSCQQQNLFPAQSGPS